MRWLIGIFVALTFQQSWWLGSLNAVPKATVEGYPSVPAGAAPVWRFWSPVYQRHFYTIREAEKDKVLDRLGHVWTYEGIAYRAFPSCSVDGLAPVHRFWSDRIRAHFYTISERERDKLINDYASVWTYEGVAFYAYPAGRQPGGTIAVHRFWSDALRTHFYTTSDPERFKLAGLYSHLWDYEGVAWYAYPSDINSVATIVNGPYLQQVKPDSVTIVWETDIPADSEVRYGVGTSEEFIVSDPAMATLHRLVLAGLVADTLHAYRATSGGSFSTGTFETAPAAQRPFRFAVYGDTRTYPDTHRQVVTGIIQSGPEIAFHTGDIVGRGRDYFVWETEFFDPASELISHTPVVPVPGNHDYAGEGPPWFYYYFDRPLNEGWFSMTYGSVRFIGLDTSVAYWPGSPQYEWLLRELGSAEYGNATWHVVIFHEPPFTCTTGHTDNAVVQSHLVPLFEPYGVDVAFQGHSHAYERYLHNGIYYIVTGGGGGPLYPLAPDTVPPIREFGLAVHHHCVADVDPAAGTLTITAVDMDGQVFDRVELSAAQQE